MAKQKGYSAHPGNDWEPYVLPGRRRLVASEFNEGDDPGGFDKIDSEKVSKTIAVINEALKDKSIDRP